jgi:hypothetical protein
MTIRVRTLGEDMGQTYFNANKMPAAQVANLFVKNSHLDQLTSRDNVILVGPRGSGKTTLMKMLTREALDAWDTPKAKELIDRAVLPLYIGSDTVVRSQLQVPEGILKDARSLSAFAIVRRAKLGVHFLQTVLGAARHELAAGRAELDLEREQRAVARLASAYRLRPSFRSFEALSDSATDLLLELSSAIQAAADQDTTGVRQLAREVRVPALSDLITATQEAVVEAFQGLPSKWALLFDEIEYMPEASRHEILQLIRALGPSFAVKIAFTPLSLTTDYFTEVEKSFLHAGHDYLPLSLAYNDSNAILRFALDLHESMLDRVLEGKIEIPEVFGVSAFADPRTRVAWPHLETSRRPPDDELVAELARKQPRFARYAERVGLTASGEVRSQEAVERSATFRKAMPVMLLWRERLKGPANLDTESLQSAGSALSLRRGRKSHAIYTGYPTFLLLNDGNPRVMMGILNRLLSGAHEEEQTGDARRPLFPSEWQDAAIEGARRDQLALANAYLSAHGRVLGNMFAVDVLHGIGQLFEQSVHFGQEFNPDPPTSFKVDKPPDPRLAGALVDAVYTGALVELQAVQNENNLIRPESDLVGRRFRLSYLQSSHFWLPVRKGRETALSTLLARLSGRDEGSEEPWSVSDQARMF